MLLDLNFETPIQYVSLHKYRMSKLIQPSYLSVEYFTKLFWVYSAWVKDTTRIYQLLYGYFHGMRKSWVSLNLIPCQMEMKLLVFDISCWKLKFHTKVQKECHVIMLSNFAASHQMEEIFSSPFLCITNMNYNSWRFLRVVSRNKKKYINNNQRSVLRLQTVNLKRGEPWLFISANYLQQKQLVTPAFAKASAASFYSHGICEEDVLMKHIMP